MKDEIKYLNNQYIRAINSPDFNFALDKETGVSICWGRTENEEPIYDPISPQELIFEINDKTSIYDIINNFNIITDVRYKKNEQLIAIPEIKIENYDNFCKDPTVITASTINSIIFNIKNSKNISDTLNKILMIQQYLKKFNVIIFIQINSSITNDNINQLKFITSNIIVNINQSDNYKDLKNNNFNTHIKTYINQHNFYDILNKLKGLNKETLGIIYIMEKINVTKLRELQGRIKNLNLNLNLHCCNLYKYKQEKQNFEFNLPILNCDATTYSLYIKDNKIYSCEFNDKPFAKFTKTSTKDKLWYNKNLCQFREKIIKDTYC